MELKYYTRLRGRILGPFSVEQLRSRARNGKFGRHYEVSNDQKSWEPASTHPELFPSADPEPTTPTQMLEKDGNTVGAETSLSGQEFFYAVEDDPIGPVQLSQLEAMLQSGRLQADSLVWTHGFSEWVAVEEIPALEPLLDYPIAEEHPHASESGHSHLASWSLVFGLLGATFCLILASPIAIVLGHMALSKIKASAGELGGRKSAIAGLALGYIVIISAVIVSIVLVCLAILQDARP